MNNSHDGLITLADPSGDIKTVELSSRFAVIREMANGQAINTNNYQTAEMQRREIPIDSGMPGYRTSPERVDRAIELLIEGAEGIERASGQQVFENLANLSIFDVALEMQNDPKQKIRF
jgi:hypothetical protein